VADIPDEMKHLLEERTRARFARDFEAADALRKRIREAGYEVEDAPGGPILRRADEAFARIPPGAVVSVLDQEPRFEVSVHWLVQGWAEDAARGIEAFRRHTPDPAPSVQHVVVDTGDADPAAWPGGVEVVALDRDPGWGAARNAGLKRAAGKVVIVVDSSVEPTGNVLTPLLDALRDPSVGVAGPVGAVTADLREFHPSKGPEVDAVEGYLMAFRRDVVMRAGLFDEGFRFYRAADLDMSFRIRDMGLRAVSVALPLRRHEHRMWTHTPRAERDRLSKRNYYRFLDRWRGRVDLCSGGSGPTPP
jgi:glycosyltransferase involved in cell wall biosynthesis